MTRVLLCGEISQIANIFFNRLKKHEFLVIFVTFKGLFFHFEIKIINLTTYRPRHFLNHHL
jgi:hypothetical protein